jgi:hypothetical protein
VAILATAVALVGASILLVAGLEKARDPASTTSTLRQLGLPAVLANVGMLVIPAELAVALGLVFRPDSGVTQAGVVLLAGAFAVAGLLALRRDEPVRCTCFGSGRSGYLGSSQLLALVPWVGGAAFLHVATLTPPSPSRGAAMLAGAGLTMAAVRLIPLLGAWREARGDRLSARETYLWLHR